MSERVIKITAGSVTIDAALNDTDTAATIWDALPIEASANTWGDEIYFGIPVSAGEEMGQEVVELGDLGYWPPGSAFCMFFGPHPHEQGRRNSPRQPRHRHRTHAWRLDGPQTSLVRRPRTHRASMT